MVKVLINSKDNVIDSVKITGHSGYSEAGSDIVCASISSICITTVNAIIRIDSNSIDYSETEGYLKVDIKKHTDVVDILIENMIELLSELAKDYKDYIKINK